MASERFLTAGFEVEGLHRFDVYAARGGYLAAAKALKEMSRRQVIDEVRRAGLRGGGGAGFPAGLKWGFVQTVAGRPTYLCVNADEGEPGTFKDGWILRRNPHLLIEGMIIAAYAAGAETAFVYVRGEYEDAARILSEAIAEAEARGALGPDVLGTGMALDVIVQRGAGAYICGEETALLESLEGRRGLPRLKPPFPAAVGLYGSPTVVNNVETLANVPAVIGLGADAFAARGVPGDGGTRLFSVSGNVRRPGIYEAGVGTPLRTLIFDLAGGPPEGRRLKAVIPGGLSAPVLGAEEIDLPMACEIVAGAGSMLGSAAVIVIDDAAPMFDVLAAVVRFYAHESCGQCTPCRVGTSWMKRIVDRMAAGGATPEDPGALRRVAQSIQGRTLCPFGDAAALPVQALIAKFGDEILASARARGRGA
jgi:NADH-quinone oxidoreductase subunit F